VRPSLHNAYYATLCLVLAGCPAPAVLDAGAPVAALVVDAGPLPTVDAGPPGPLVLDVAVPGELDPVQQLDIRIPAVIADYRLRVFDDGDRVVPSNDTAKEADGGIDYAISFTEPLKAGHKYRLTIEAQRGDEAPAFQEVERVFRIRGEIEKPPKKTKSKRK
jgi:hypothetical protein